MSGKGQETSTSAGVDPVKQTTLAVGRNVARLRGADGMPARELAERLVAKGLRMSVSGIQDIEAGRRTVSVDQLTALSEALGVSPLALLMPHSVTGDSEIVSLTGVEPTLGMQLFGWLRAEYPLDYEGRGGGEEQHEVTVFRRRSTPPWAWKR